MSELTLVKVPHCWKLRVAAHMCRVACFVNLDIFCNKPSDGTKRKATDDILKHN